VNLLGLEVRDFQWLLAAGLHTNPRSTDDIFSLWRRISDCIRGNGYQDMQTVLLLDDVHEASHEVLVNLLRLVNTHSREITAILAVKPSSIARLGTDLLQLSQLRIHLEPWDNSDVRDYLRSSLSQAGGRPDLFAAGAVSRLQELTGGVPRWVNELAELALLVGAEEEDDQVDAETIERAYQQLSAKYHEHPSDWRSVTH
jgi:general secretion pathway protein A